MQHAVRHAVRADRRWRRARETRCKERIGPDERAIGVGDLVRARVEHVERVELQSQAVLETIAGAGVEQAGRRRAERAVLGQRPRPEIAVFHAAEPARRLAEFEAGGQDELRRFRNEIARRAAGLRKRIAGQIKPRLHLCGVVAAKARARHRDIDIGAQPRHRLEMVRPFDTDAAACAARDRAAGIAFELVLRIEIENEQACRRDKAGNDPRPQTDFRALRFHEQRRALDRRTIIRIEYRGRSARIVAVEAAPRVEKQFGLGERPKNKPGFRTDEGRAARSGIEPRNRLDIGDVRHAFHARHIGIDPRAKCRAQPWRPAQCRIGPCADRSLGDEIVAHRGPWQARKGVLQADADAVVARLHAKPRFRRHAEQVVANGVARIDTGERAAVELPELVADVRLAEIVGEVVEQVQRRMDDIGFHLRRRIRVALRPARRQREAARIAAVGRIERAVARNEADVDRTLRHLIRRVPAIGIGHAGDGEPVVARALRPFRDRIDLAHFVGPRPRPVVDRAFRRHQQIAGPERKTLRAEQPLVVEGTGRHGEQALRQTIDIGHADRAGGGEIAFVGVIRAFLHLDRVEQFRHQEIEIGIALPMPVRAHVERHAIEEQREIGAVIELKAAQKILVGFALAAVLRDDETGHDFQRLCRPVERLVIHLCAGERHRARRRRVCGDWKTRYGGGDDRGRCGWRACCCGDASGGPRRSLRPDTDGARGAGGCSWRLPGRRRAMRFRCGDLDFWQDGLRDDRRGKTRDAHQQSDARHRSQNTRRHV